jgi:hypothetical protein
MAIEIQESGGGNLRILTLYVDGSPVAHAHLDALKPQPTLNWAVYGPQNWDHAKELLQGLLELSVHLDHFTQGLTHGQQKTRRGH